MGYKIKITKSKQEQVQKFVAGIDPVTQQPKNFPISDWQWNVKHTRILTIPKTKNNFDLLAVLNRTAGVKADGSIDTQTAYNVEVIESSDDTNPVDIKAVFHCDCGSTLFDTEVDASQKPTNYNCKDCGKLLATLS